jgi:hypothetical protein
LLMIIKIINRIMNKTTKAMKMCNKLMVWFGYDFRYFSDQKKGEYTNVVDVKQKRVF